MKEINEKQLESYRSLLKRRTAVSIAAGLFAAAISIADYYKLFGHKRIEAFSGLFRGALIALGLGALLVILNYIKAFDNPGTLKRLYAEEHDPEDTRARAFAGLPFTAYFAGILAISGIIAAYFSRPAFIALFCAAIMLILSSLGTKYIVKKYYPEKRDK